MVRTGGGAVIRIGAEVEIKPGFECSTGERTSWDEIAGCVGVITQIRRDRLGNPNDYVDVQIKNGDEVEVHVHRLKFKEVT